MARATPAGATGTAETAELRNAEGKKGGRNCGRTAERLRKPPSLPSSLPLADASQASAIKPTRSRASRPSPGALVPSKMAREWLPVHPTPARRTVDLVSHEEAVIGAALAILESRLREPSPCFNSPRAIEPFLRLHLARFDREHFGVMFLDAVGSLIAFEVLFAGTANETAVHAREVLRRALQLNAVAVIVAHNHPSGRAEPSAADERLTARLHQALCLVGVRLLDHWVVGSDGATSFRERGLL